jgi:predicted MFS family arabinose efflux permease
MQEARTKTNSRRIHPIRDMGEALHLAKSDPAIMSLLMSKMTFAVGAGVVSQLAVYAADSFNSGDAGRGLMLGLRGLGSALGPLVAARFVRDDLSRVILVCGISGLGFAGGYLAAAASPILIIAAIFIGLAHLGGGAQWTLSTYGLQMRCPDEMRGRVLAGDFALITLSLGLSSLAAGVVSEYIGARGAITVFALLAVCASVVYLLATRTVRAKLKISAI